MPHSDLGKLTQSPDGSSTSDSRTLALPQPTRLPTPAQLPQPGLPPLPTKQHKPGSPNPGSSVDTRGYINPEGFPNASRIKHSHEKGTGLQLNNIEFAPVTLKPPRYRPNEAWRVAVPPPGDAGRRQLLNVASPQKRSSPKKKMRPTTMAWVGAAAKRAQLEHDEATHEFAVIEAVYQGAPAQEEPAPRMFISECVALVTFCILIASPVILALIAFAAGFGIPAIVLAAVLPLSALPALWLTPLSIPADVAAADSFAASDMCDSPLDIYPSPVSSPFSRSSSPASRRFGSLSPPKSVQQGSPDSSPFGRSSTQAAQIAEASNAQQEFFANNTQFLLFATGLVQLALACTATELHDNLVASALVTFCATFQLIAIGAWQLSTWSRGGCFAGAVSALDRATENWRLMRAAVLRAAEEELSKRVDTGAASSALSLSLNGILVAALNEFGTNIRQSPLKALVITLNLVVAVGLGLRPPFEFSFTAAVSFVAAIGGAVAASDYVRSITNEVDYAEGLRGERERREEVMTRRNAQELLETTLQLPLHDRALEALTDAIDAAEEAHVSSTLLAASKERLEIVREASLLRRENDEQQRKLEATAIEAARRELGAVVASAPLQMDLGRLMLAIDAARAVNVPREIIDSAEEKLKECTHAHGRRESATGRLQAFLHLDPVDVAVGVARPPAVVDEEEPTEKAEGDQEEPTEKAEGDEEEAEAPEENGELTALMGVDLAELDSTVEEARAAGVNEADIEKVLAFRNEVVKAQVGINAKVAMAHVKLRRMGLMGRWKKSGGEERLTRAAAAGRDALELLSSKNDRGPLSAATEILSLVHAEAVKMGLQTAEIMQAEELLRKLRAASVSLDRSQMQLDNALRAAQDVRSHDQMMTAETTLVDAIRVSREVHVDSERIRVAEESLNSLYTLIRASNKANERLVSATAFTKEQLRLFHAKQSSQLKMVAVPALTSALSLARSSLIPNDKIQSGEDMLKEAIKARERVEEAAKWLNTASKAAVKALSHMSEEGSDEARNVMQVAIETLVSAVKGAKNDGVDAADIASAESLLATLRMSVRRQSLRSLPNLPPAMVAQYSNVSGDGQGGQYQA